MIRKPCGLAPPPKFTVNAKAIIVPHGTLELTEKINGFPVLVALPEGAIVP